MDCHDRISAMVDDAERERLNWPHGEPLIISPTHGRAGNLPVLQLLPDIPLCVAVSQEAKYRAAHPGVELVIHPDEVVGIGAKRQWIYEKFGDVFMLDDDVARCHDLTRGAREKMQVLDPQRVRDLIYRLFDQAEQMGAYLVGFNFFAHPGAFRPQRPFQLTGSAAGRAFGVREGGDIWFPKHKHIFTDDLYISALNAHKHRFCLLDQRYCFLAPGTWAREGGMNHLRTWETMQENNRLMDEAFGDAVVKKQGTKLAGLTHEAQIAIKVPW
jgi:hypothetical protein